MFSLSPTLLEKVSEIKKVPIPSQNKGDLISSINTKISFVFLSTQQISFLSLFLYLSLLLSLTLSYSFSLFLSYSLLLFLSLSLFLSLTISLSLTLSIYLISLSVSIALFIFLTVFFRYPSIIYISLYDKINQNPLFCTKM